MKKSILAIIALSLGGVVAQASDPEVMSLEKTIDGQKYEATVNNSNVAAGTNNDKFQQLLDLAHQGHSVSFSDIEGIYTGRCYDMINRNLPRSSALVLIQVDTNPSDGPLFPKEKLVIEGGYEGSADIADSKTKETLISDLMPLKSNYSSVVENPLSVALNDTPSTSHKMTYVKNQNYIIGLTSANQNQTIYMRGDGKTTLNAGDVWMACYYFNKK